MDNEDSVRALAALAHTHRLAVFRLLVGQGPQGLAAGAIAKAIGLAPSSLTFHLHHLHRAGLVTQRRESRQLFYAADFAAMNALVGYLTDHCCDGDVAACVPVKQSKPLKRKTA
ncbi:MAG: ArsR family transcriptional regulator [Pseudomonadota bacterium]|nr:ArsR family transcriptional regulator [Pseudomonadota bacterium]